MAELDERLVLEWRRTRDPRIVEELRKRLALKVRRAPREGNLDGAWSAAIEQKNFQELLDLLLSGTLNRIAQKVIALSELDDPRVNLVLQPALVALGPEAREDVLPAVIEVLGRSKDVGCRWYLDQWAEEDLGRVDAALAQLAKVKVKQLPDLGALVNPKPQREADLFAAVYRDPSDLNARAVLGDALQERGDPRGEFIGLQLGKASAATEARCKDLLSRHWREWVSPLQVNQSSTQGSKLKSFERGFPTAAVVDRLEGQEHLREWATVEHLYADRMFENQAAMRKLAGSSKALRSLFWLDLESASLLKSSRLENVGLWCMGDVEKKHLAGLTGLRALWLVPSIGFKRATLPWDRIERLFLYDRGPSLEEWREQVLARRGGKLVQVSILDASEWMPHVSGWELRFRLDVDPELKKPELIWHGRGRSGVLEGLTPSFLRTLKFVTVHAPPADQKPLAARLGSKFVAGRALSRGTLNAPPFERLTFRIER